LSDTLWEAVMGDRSYLPSLVAITLIRETLRMASEADRLAVAGAAHRYSKERSGMLSDVLRDVAERNHEPGIRGADARGVAAAEFVEMTFAGDMPDVDVTACLGEGDRADNLIAIAVQATYAEMDGHLRLRFKQALRLCASCAAAPLDDEVSHFLALCDSQDAWELEQQLDFTTDGQPGADEPGTNKEES
jgi:hypothetical protein